MRGVPDCLNRRYKALDELINELSSGMSNRGSGMDRDSPTHDPEIKLMCNFWNILKESPDCNLPQAVQQRMCMNAQCSSGCIPRQHFTCCMAHADRRPIKPSCCGGSGPPSGRDTPTSPAANSDLPLNKVLCNLKAAASFDKKCTARLNELLATEKQLKAQIQILEAREKDGVVLLKQADCMWSCMEEAYKQKVAASLERQKTLLKQFKEVETSASKWRKNKKDLESQLDSVNKCHTEITDKINQKNNDIKYLDMEIEGFKKRIDGNKKESTAVKNSLNTKTIASDAKIAAIAIEAQKLQALLKEERKRKNEKDYEGAQYIKEAREELRKINCVLLQKKLENEDKKAEKEGLLLEIDLLKETCENCKEKCKKKQLTIGDEINKIDAEIAAFKVRCIQCHECIDTSDVRKMCTDCPKCAGDRECIIDGDHCDPDHSYDCVCQVIKQKFLDNVFDNMYTVLEKQSKTAPGKAVANAVMSCLKNSRNGKLNEETRKILQDFVLTTVKKNLNLTIVGGAVKTRCEMDPDTYKQLMTCLKQVKATPPPKADKGTNAKKDSCRRWGGTSECNCPKGPKSCICTRKAPPAANDPTPCPPQPQDKEDAANTIQCPHKKDTPCGPDCGMHLPSNIGEEVAAWKQDPCQGPSCKFNNMRAAQCILGPESLSSVTTQSYKTAVPFTPDMSLFDHQMSCKCGASSSRKTCTCFGDLRSQPRERIIDEVMGRYIEVPPIEKVSSMEVLRQTESNKGRNSEQKCVCGNVPFGELFRSNIFENMPSYSRASSKDITVQERSGLKPNFARSSRDDDETLSSSDENVQRSKNRDARRQKPSLYDSDDVANQSVTANKKKSKQKLLKDRKSSIKMEEKLNSDVLLVERDVNKTVKDLVNYIISGSVSEILNLDFTNTEHTLEEFLERLSPEVQLGESTIKETEMRDDSFVNKKNSKYRKNSNNKRKKRATLINENASCIVENIDIQSIGRNKKETVAEADTSSVSLIQSVSSLYRPLLQVPFNTEVGEYFENNDNPLINYHYLYQRLKKIQQGMQHDFLSAEDFNYARSVSSDVNYIQERLRRIKESREKSRERYSDKDKSAFFVQLQTLFRQNKTNGCAQKYDRC